MALNSGKILMRRGQEVNFDPSKMTPGEWAVSLDSKYVRMCFQPGVCVRMATYDAFEADMVQIQKILAECQTVEEAVQRIYEEIKDVAVDVERIETAAANALKSEQNALNSANSASQSANTATQKASDAAGSANTASAKAEQATEGARISTEKASEAANSAENVRNMSDVSQSYAVGGTGTREGEDTDNSKYYNQQASDNADRAEEAAERASAVADVGVATTEKAGLVKPDGETIRVDPDGTIHADRGTTSYADLENKPKINDVVLEGEKTLEELGIASKEALEKTDSKVNIIIEQAELRFKETASGEYIHLDDSADSKLVEFGLYGKATQDREPTPENPVDIVVAGSSGSVEVKSVGKNLFDELLENYSLAGSLQEGYSLYNAANSQTFVGKININKNYTIKNYSDGNRFRIVLFKNYPTDKTAKDALEIVNNPSLSEYTFNSLEYKYAVFTINVNNANIKTKKAQLEIGTVVTEYVPYREPITATIPTENGLAGIPVESGGNYTDSNGQQWICDEIVKYADGSGEYVQKVGKIVFDGSSDEKINAQGISNNDANAYRYIFEGAKDVAIYDVVQSNLCSHLKYEVAWNGTVGHFYNVSNYGFAVLVNFPTVEELRAWLASNPITFVYLYNNPIRTSLTSEQLAEIEKLHTFYPVTSISNDADCGMKVKYIADAKSYIDNRLALIEQAMLNSI